MGFEYQLISFFLVLVPGGYFYVLFNLFRWAWDRWAHVFAPWMNLDRFGSYWLGITFDFWLVYSWGFSAWFMRPSGCGVICLPIFFAYFQKLRWRWWTFPVGLLERVAPVYSPVYFWVVLNKLLVVWSGVARFIRAWESFDGWIGFLKYRTIYSSWNTRITFSCFLFANGDLEARATTE